MIHAALSIMSGSVLKSKNQFYDSEFGILLMICPTCLSRAMALLARSGFRPPLHGEPNIVTQYRCEKGHSFQTVQAFDGTSYQEHYVPFTEIMSLITICWD
jgi:hypothetical protein